MLSTSMVEETSKHITIALANLSMVKPRHFNSKTFTNGVCVLRMASTTTKIVYVTIVQVGC